MLVRVREASRQVGLSWGRLRLLVYRCLVSAVLVSVVASLVGEAEDERSKQVVLFIVLLCVTSLCALCVSRWPLSGAKAGRHIWGVADLGLANVVLPVVLL